MNLSAYRCVKKVEIRIYQRSQGRKVLRRIILSEQENAKIEGYFILPPGNFDNGKYKHVMVPYHCYAFTLPWR
jgi:hypothetical protein